MEARLVYFIENRCAFYFLIDLVVPGLSRCVKCGAVCEDDGVIQRLSDMLVVDISGPGCSVSNFQGYIFIRTGLWFCLRLDRLEPS